MDKKHGLVWYIAGSMTTIAVDVIPGVSRCLSQFQHSGWQTFYVTAVSNYKPANLIVVERLFTARHYHCW